MAEISREALLQLAARGYKEEVKRVVSLLGEQYKLECVHEASEQDSFDIEKLKDVRRKVSGGIRFLCDLSAKNNTKPLLPGIANMSEAEISNCCFGFAETMYKVSKRESYEIG
jgi:hypothetical protein